MSIDIPPPSYAIAVFFLSFYRGNYSVSLLLLSPNYLLKKKLFSNRRVLSCKDFITIRRCYCRKGFGD